MKFHHIGIATRDLGKSVRNHQEMFKLSPVTSVVKDDAQNAYMVTLSDCEDKGLKIELISPVDEKSPVFNMLRKGISIYHICYEVKDLASSLKESREHGAIILCKPTESELFGGRKISFIYTPDGYVVEFLEEGT